MAEAVCIGSCAWQPVFLSIADVAVVAEACARASATCGADGNRPEPLAGGVPVAVDRGDHSWRTYVVGLGDRFGAEKRTA